MNDPHVDMLVYKIEYNKSIIDYSKAKPFCRDEQNFRLSVAKGEARFKLKNHYHYPTIDAADEAIADYRHAWEFEAQLHRGPGSFHLSLDPEESKLSDRNPTPESKTLSASGTTGHFSGSVNLAPPRPPEYPKPPSSIKLNSDIRVMYVRYMDHLRGHEPLGSMAYFCCTMLEGLPTQQSSGQRRTSKKRKDAAKKFAIEEWVLNKIGCLSSTKGGKQHARKWEGKDQRLSSAERDFLKQAVKAIIRRVAEREYMPKGDLPIISRSDLPSLENDSDSEPIQRSSK